MRKKLKRRYARFIEQCIKRANGFPLECWMWDHYSKQSVEEGLYYKKFYKQMREDHKAGRVETNMFDGS